jgi:formate hydrogenlyase subunit 4
MSLLLSLVAQILHLGLMIAAAPLAAGVSDWLDARFTSRTGAPVMLPWRNLVRLSRKTPAETDSGSAVLHYAPVAALGITLSAAALAPSFSRSMALSPLADILVIASLLTSARVAMVLAALDQGESETGLAAQQSSALAVPAEAALILATFAIALMAGGFNLDLVMGQARDGGLSPVPAAALVLSALAAMALTDDGFALTGLDEAAAGKGLAMSRLTGWLRRLVWLDLIGALVLPFGYATAGAGPLEWSIGLACWAVKLGVMIVFLAGVRALLGRITARRAAEVAAAAAMLALIAAVMVLASARMA